MAVLSIGISYKTAPIEVRERLTITAGELPGALTMLGERFGSGVVLSTCNRTEVYISHAGSDTTADDVVQIVLRAKGYPAGESVPPFHHSVGMHAVRHLYRVAAGTDSMIVGESQVLGQVRGAMQAAREAGTLDTSLARLFDSAVAVGRRARRETGIGRNAVSISSAGVALAREKLGGLGAHTVLVVSAGEAGKLAARHVVEYGAGRLLVTNRSPQRAAEVAAQLGGTAVPFEALGDALAESDLVVSSSGSPGYLIDRPTVEAALRQRGERPMVFIDIAVPRDIDPAIAELPGVYVYDIDDLQTVAEGNLQGRVAEVEQVERIVEEETARFAAWWRAREAVPTIAALRKHAGDIRDAEVARTFARLPGLGEEERRRIEAMSNAIVKRILHEPITRLRDGGRGARYVEAMQELFDLPNPAAESPDPPPPPA